MKVLTVQNLLPDQPVQVPPIGLSQLRQHRVLEEGVVPGPSHGLVPVELETKSPVLPKDEDKGTMSCTIK